MLGGGCAGFQYDMTFDEKQVEENGQERMVPAGPDDPALPFDRKLDLHGVCVVVDEMSLMYLRGTEIDYVDSLQGTGFKFNNPLATQCGCGMSFQA